MPLKKYKTVIVWMLAVGMAVAGLIRQGMTQTTTTQGTAAMSSRPDVLVLVYQRPGLSDEVGITYARRVPHAQAQAELQALAQATGWAMSQTQIKDGGSPTHQKIGPMTSVSFVAPNVILNDTHTLPVEAFVTAFRAEKRLNLIFIVASGFQFQGLRQFADNNVRITQEQHGSAFTYQIQILNSQFQRLNLPQSAPSAEGTVGAGRRGRARLLLFGGILVAAGGTGLLVYFWMSRFQNISEKPYPDADSRDDDKTADDKTETGTKR